MAVTGKRSREVWMPRAGVLRSGTRTDCPPVLSYCLTCGNTTGTSYSPVDASRGEGIALKPTPTPTLALIILLHLPPTFNQGSLSLNGAHKTTHEANMSERFMVTRTTITQINETEFHSFITFQRPEKNKGRFLSGLSN